MSLFKARDWWATYAGSDEEFDLGCLCVANIDNNGLQIDKIIVGSYHGILRIYCPKPPHFKPDDLMLEVQLQQPILQVEAGKFVSGVDQLHLAVLHPRKLAVYSVSVVSGAVEHGNHYTLKMMYEHILERTAYKMTYGPFGSVKNKDFICIQSMDGMLSFFEQESFAFGRFLPGFLLPGALSYVAKTDSFVICSSSRLIESYKYQTLAVATDANTKEDIGNKKVSGKKLTMDWSSNIGESAIDIVVFTSANAPLSIYVLGERSLFCLNENGSVRFMKKFEYNPSCFIPYNSVVEGTVNALVATYNKTLMIYQDVTLAWAAQLPHIPVSLKVASFQELQGVIVTLDEGGYLHCAYLGTDPSMMVTPAPEARDINYEEADVEMKELQKEIKESTISSEILPKAQQREDLVISVNVPTSLDQVSQSAKDDGDDDTFPSITVTITLKSQAPSPLENVVLSVISSPPIMCNRSSIVFPIIGDRSEPVSAEISFYSRGGSVPCSLKAQVTATYVTNSEAPRVAQTDIHFPLAVVCKGCPPVKNATHKLTLDTNKPPVNLAEIFPDMVNDAVIPMAAVGIQYFGGPIVTILASKTSQRYRIQCDVFQGMWLVLHEVCKRLEAHFKKNKDTVQFRASFMGPLPLQEYYELIDAHFEQRCNQTKYRELLSQRAQQFRAIQRRLLTRFKDKTPAPLANLDTLLDGTYRQLLALGEAEEECERAIEAAAYNLSCGTRLINFLIKLWTNMSDKDFEVLQTALSPEVSESQEQGWEEITDAAITHLLRTCLAKSAKDQAVGVSAMKIPKDTSKLKKHIALMCDRLSKGGKLDLSLSSQTGEPLVQQQQQKAVTPLEPLSEMQEEEDETDSSYASSTLDGDRASEISDTESVSSSEKVPPRLPQLNHSRKPLPDLNKRMLVTPGSDEESMVLKGIGAASLANGLPEDHERVL
ncbi:protein PTHB1-like [Stylophora pistillata]|uniref:Protein PTHB1 n=1 Tax=Stylophora pistillata TaxID=50429 RepID=A0A2B4S4X7_STYPI|nr:protein PTHB1-like [Stylophora pistillata]PFX24103.1 Protein PTHB1 [Stylophora pistillata]